MGTRMRRSVYAVWGVGLGVVVAGCAAEGALANAMIVQGDAEGSLVKTTAEGLPVCDVTREGAVFYLAPSDELVFCSGGTYQTLGQGVCEEEEVDVSAPEPEGGVLDAGETVACQLVHMPDGRSRVTCEDGTEGELRLESPDGSVDPVGVNPDGQYD